MSDKIFNLLNDNHEKDEVKKCRDWVACIIQELEDVLEEVSDGLESLDKIWFNRITSDLMKPLNRDNND